MNAAALTAPEARLRSREILAGHIEAHAVSRLL
jgi:hypothetical protein